MADRYDNKARELWESLVEVAAVSNDGQADNVTEIAAAIRQAVESERERCAAIARDYAEHAYCDRIEAGDDEPVWNLREREVVCREVQRAIKDTTSNEPNTSPEQAEVLTRMQKYPKVDATAFASAAEPFTEPARPIPSTLDDRAHNVEITTQAIAQLARDFARDALREFVDYGGACISTDMTAVDEAITAAIAAAERGAK